MYLGRRKVKHAGTSSACRWLPPAVLPWVHRDPVGRLQVAQAMEDGMTLLIVDASLKQWRGL